MKALVLLPCAAALSGCALFAPHTTTDAPRAAEGQIAVIETEDGMMILGDERRFRGETYATYVEHLVDDASGDVTETLHYVVIDGQRLSCPQADCDTMLSGYFEGETYDIVRASPAR